MLLMTGSQGRGNAEMLHQALGVTGVLGGNQGDLTQNLQRPGTDIVQVADGRRHHIERASSGIQSTWSSQSAHLMIGKTAIVTRSDARDTGKRHPLLRPFVAHSNIYTR